jgi:hypothetical protein
MDRVPPSVVHSCVPRPGNREIFAFETPEEERDSHIFLPAGTNRTHVKRRSSSLRKA